MAAPIAHIFLALQMLAGPFYGLFNEVEFIVGTSFPDIRYLKVISREQTHFVNVTLEDILHEKDSFKAGMLFHSFVDEQREAYIVDHGFYQKFPHFRFITQALKLAEDELLRSLCNGLAYQHYFDDILEQERLCNISEYDIRRWHAYLQEYCRGIYSCKKLLMKYFDLIEPNAWWIKRFVFKVTYGYRMEQLVASIIQSRWARKRIFDFYLHFAARYTSKTQKKTT